jgi:hypothetical protein
VEPSEVLFIGGGWPKLASVNIRCVDIARWLGCAYQVNVRSISEIPERYRAFICVKTRLPHEDLQKLADRGPVVWDIIDALPPENGFVSRYIASTEVVRELFGNGREIDLIPHYHCNFSGDPNPPGELKPAWIGQRHWYPRLEGFDHAVYDISGKGREEVVDAYRQAGIGLNLRSSYNGAMEHSVLNAGIKLINCIGFGIPSISAMERPYKEIGDGCTIFTDTIDCAHLVHRLRSDTSLYSEMRSNCIERAKSFHIEAIAQKYRALIAAL